MCGRYTQTSDAKTLMKRFAVKKNSVGTSIIPRYNISPSQSAPVVLSHAERQLIGKSWGLRPPWATAGSEHKMINARADSAHEKPAYREPFRHRRCLVPADGFYEWKKTPAGPKIPVRFSLKSGEPFAMAGLWEGETFTILTTEANALVGKIHKRMPVILAPENEDLWMDPQAGLEDLLSILLPFDAGSMKSKNASKDVHSPKNEGPALLEGEPDPQPELDF